MKSLVQFCLCLFEKYIRHQELSYFFIAVIKHNDQDNLVFNWAYSLES